MLGWRSEAQNMRHSIQPAGSGYRHKVSEWRKAVRGPYPAPFCPATKLIINGIIARTQGFEAVSIPPGAATWRRSRS